MRVVWTIKFNVSNALVIMYIGISGNRNRCVMKPKKNKETKGRVVSKYRLLIQNNEYTKIASESDISKSNK